jgi:hypothetical protein
MKEARNCRGKGEKREEWLWKREKSRRKRENK